MKSRQLRPVSPPLLGRSLIAPLMIGILGGCQHMKPDILPTRAVTPGAPIASPAASAPTPAEAASAAQPGAAVAKRNADERLFQTPGTPPAQRSATRAAPARSNPAEPQIEASVSLEQLPLPVFIDTVYATILKRNVSVDPSIAQRKELVSLKSGKALTASALAESAKVVLKSYGLAVTEFDNLVRVTPSGGSSGYLPELQRGRASPDVPASLRPVFYLAELESVSPTAVSGWVRTLFGQRVNVQEDMPRQAVLLSGQNDDVSAAMEAIQVLDQPLMRGRSSARISPLFWSADELAKRLGDIMTAQGYSVGQAATSQTPIILLPVGPLNSIIVFAASETVLNHALRWAKELDQPASGRGTAGYFTYPVRNMDATDLAKTLQDVMNPAGTGATAANSVRSRVVVNAASNTLIIQGSPTEYQQWFGLLQELDRPARTALVSVTVAEVRLDDTETLGFSWILDQFRLGGYNVALASQNGTSATGGGIVAKITSRNSSTSALLNVMAATTKAKILANPSILARNGESATIQVGQDVPIITQQQQGTLTSTVPGGAAQSNILQSIQYRNTGVILKVKPVIHAGGRIDLDVEQEVSAAVENKTGVTSTPIFSNRKLTTKLSVADGTTVLLGGLMRQDNSVTDSGIPLLKDIPFAGHLFKSSTDQRIRTELIVLVTPYVVNDEFEATAISEAFRKQFSWDSTVPGQSLRPPLRETQPELPEDARNLPTSPQSKPYLLPSQEEEQRSRAQERPSLSVAPGQQTTRDFPADRPVTEAPGAASNKVTPPTNAGASASRPAAPVEQGNKQGAGVGKPVDDPQILKELMDALNRKR